MNQQLIIQVSAGVLFFIAIVGLTVIVLASVYDLRAISRRRYLGIVTRRLRKPNQPHVTILVHGSTDSRAIAACLRSILRSRYRNYDVVVIDCDLAHLIRQTVQGYRHKHPQIPLYYYGKRKASNRLDALRAGYQKSQKGELIFVLDAASSVAPMVLKESVARFITNGKLLSLQLNKHDSEMGSIAQLLQRLRQLSERLVSKSTSLIFLHRLTVGTPNVFYRRASFLGKIEYQMPHAQYEGGIIVSTIPPPVGVHRQALPELRTGRSWIPALQAPLLVGTVFFITYFLYVAMTLQSSSLLILSWLISVIWLLAAVWSDEASGRREKITLSFCIPPLYFLIYSQLIVVGIMKAVRFVTSPLRNYQWFRRVDGHLAERPL